MTPEQRAMLEMAKPYVTLQTAPVGARHNDSRNNAIDVACGCAAEGWLRHVRDDDEFQQCVYEITRAGREALEKKE